MILLFLSPCISRLCHTLKTEADDVLDEFADECDLNPGFRERLSLVTRTFWNRQCTVLEDPMLFNSRTFEIEPLVRSSAGNDTLEEEEMIIT